MAQAARPHQMIVPQPGWAEHDAEQDWWGDFVFVTQKMLAESGVAPAIHRRHRRQRHRPLHAAGGRATASR